MGRFVLFFLFALLCSCAVQPPSSVVVIAVDQLHYFDFNCNDSALPPNPASAILCQESLRFTHTFTTSPLSVSAISSLLTGQYPIDHLVHINGAPGLSPNSTTVAEMAFQNGYLTSFFSAGPPVLRKTGLHQGFQLFDDRLFTTGGSYFRSFTQMTQSFFDWMDHFVHDRPFFSFFYVSELSFPTTENRNSSGTPIKPGFDTQKEVFFHSLFRFISGLKERKKWDNTAVILVGLNGRPSGLHPQYPPPINLHSEGTHVAFFYKPIYRKQDQEGTTWKVDTNVSLADIGQTLMEEVGSFKGVNQSGATPFSPQSLRPFLNYFLSKGGQAPEMNPNRPLLLESFWKRRAPHLFAVISGFQFLLLENPAQVYNTLSDPMESSPLPLSRDTTTNLQTYQESLSQFYEGTQEKPPLRSPPAPYPTYEDWMLIENRSALKSKLSQALREQPHDEETQSQLALLLLEGQEWIQLKSLGEQSPKLPLRLIADANLNLSRRVKPSQLGDDPCLLLLEKRTLSQKDLKGCSDPTLAAYVRYRKSDVLGLSSELMKQKFLERLRLLRSSQFVAKQDLALHQIWDLNPRTSFSPYLIQLVLSLPNERKGLQSNVGFEPMIEQEPSVEDLDHDVWDLD